MNIKIGLNKEIDKAKEIIYNYFPDKKLKIEEEFYGSRDLFHIDATKNKTLSEKYFYETFANIILDLILYIYSKDIISREIHKNWNNIKQDEKREIFQISNEILLDKMNYKTEKQNIKNQIRNYIASSSLILIDGFINFRLKEFNDLINTVIKKAIEEFTAEKEYKEFIKILQYFVEVQDPKYDFVNLIFENEEYKLLDDKDNIIDSDFFKDIINEIDSQGVSKSDLLISSLIVIAPKKLIVHLDEKYKDEEIIRVITSVFQDRVYFCLGCEKCNRQVKLKKGK